jgi:hypothetical protein
MRIPRQLLNNCLISHQKTPCHMSSRQTKACGRTEDDRPTLDQIEDTCRTLDCIRESLSSTVRVWDRFMSDDGDWGFFADVSSYPDISRPHICLLRKSLEDILANFKDYLLTVDRQYTDARSLAKAVSPSCSSLFLSAPCLRGTAVPTSDSRKPRSFTRELRGHGANE